MGTVRSIGSAIKGTASNIASLIGITERNKDSSIVADPKTADKLDKVIALLEKQPTFESTQTNVKKTISSIEGAFANR